jgi:uncharacterized protein YhbP (UPF0306 family)
MIITDARPPKCSIVMSIEQSHTPVDSALLAVVARDLLDSTPLCAIATVATSGEAHINTAYFAWGNALEIIWLSDPDAQHSGNIRANESIAIAIYDSHQTWGKPDRGIQLFGTAGEVTGATAQSADAIYTRRFGGYTHANVTSYRLYQCVPHRVKLFDERVFGAATFVTARPARNGQLHWERTDTYRGGPESLTSM